MNISVIAVFQVLWYVEYGCWTLTYFLAFCVYIT